MRKIYYILIILLSCSTIYAQDGRSVLDINLSNYTYPFPVDSIDLTPNQQQDLKMFYMDVKPSSNSNGKTIVLLHGKNFNGAYWKTTIEALTKNGYRVVVPDQIGFGKSSKPDSYQYSFQQLAYNTDQVIKHLGIDKFSLLGHSMGGMLATRYTLMYPEKVEKLILENPIGLEDWKLYAPYITIDESYQTELKANYESTKAYQLKFYYDNKWKPEYDEWVYLLTGWVKDSNYKKVAWNNALTTDMVFTQPVVYEFQDLDLPTLLIIGTRDRTAIGKDRVKDPEIQNKMGQYQILGKETQKKIKGSELVELDNVGHLPHIEVFERFIQPLLKFLAK